MSFLSIEIQKHFLLLLDELRWKCDLGKNCTKNIIRKYKNDLIFLKTIKVSLWTDNVYVQCAMYNEQCAKLHVQCAMCNV